MKNCRVQMNPFLKLSKFIYFLLSDHFIVYLRQFIHVWVSKHFPLFKAEYMKVIKKVYKNYFINHEYIVVNSLVRLIVKFSHVISFVLHEIFINIRLYFFLRRKISTKLKNIELFSPLKLHEKVDEEKWGREKI
jgi:hypothetical protein